MNVVTTCPFVCNYTLDQRLYSVADAAVFSSRGFKYNDFMKRYNNPKKLNVFYYRESAATEDIRKKEIPDGFFNLTAGYRRDNGIWGPYDKFEEIDKENVGEDEVWTDAQVEEKLKYKTKLVLQFVSHCKTHSKREDYVEALMKYVNVTVYGKCSKKFCFRETCGPAEIDSHFFYLAFENSVCKDYITEKFWRMKELIVPVVLKRSILKGIVDDKYFLAADDFPSPKELAKKMQYLAMNINEYKKYLGWTKYYKKISARAAVNLCKLCEIVNKREKHTIPDLFKWWQDESECDAGFAQRLITNLTV